MIQHTALEELVSISGGGTPERSRTDYYNGSIPWVTPKDMKVWDIYQSEETITEIGLRDSAARLVPAGSVLIVIRSGVLKHTLPVAIARRPVAINQDMKALIPGAGLDSEYLARFIQASSARVLQWVRATTADNFPLDELKALEVPVPSADKQRQIAQQLQKVDHLRRMRRYAIQMCEELFPSTFLHMFGDPALNPHSFPVTEGDQLFDVSRGGAKCGPFGSALKNSEYVASGIPVWTMENVQSNSFLEDGCLYVTEEKFEKLKAYAIRDGDILISRAGTVGRMAIVRTRHKRSIMHSNLIRLALDQTKIIPEYYVALMTWFGSRIAKLKTGQEDAYTFMNTGTLGELPIPLPSMGEQKKFLVFVHRHAQFRASLVEALRQADHLFQTLLHQAFR
jgi:type I restriction enzyme S subunit